MIDLTGATAADALRLRFRARMSAPAEDANLDQVRVLISTTGPDA
jgi:hypothetical protein